jgi:hypothetical protein
MVRCCLFSLVGDLLSLNRSGVILAMLAICMSKRCDPRLNEIALGYLRAAVPLVWMMRLESFVL